MFRRFTNLTKLSTIAFLVSAFCFLLSGGCGFSPLVVDGPGRPLTVPELRRSCDPVMNTDNAVRTLRLFRADGESSSWALAFMFEFCDRYAPGVERCDDCAIAVTDAVYSE